MASDEGLKPILGNRVIREQFEDANEIAGDLNEQNRQADEIASYIQDPDIRSLSIEHITTEQRRTLETLGQITIEAPYEALGEQYAETLSLLGEKVIQLTRAKATVADFETAINADAETVAWLTPRVAEEAQRLAGNKIREYADAQGIMELESAVDELSRDKEAYEALYRVAGRAWPLPLAGRISDTPVTKEPDVQKVSAELPADVLTVSNRARRVEPRTSPTHEVYDRHATRHVAEYLRAHINQIVSVDELASYLYGGDAITLSEVELKAARARVTTTLGPKRQTRDDTATVSALLAEENITLQYGGRVVKGIDDSGSPTAVRRRIYRAVPHEEFGEEHLLPIKIDDSKIKWQITDEQRALLEASKKVKLEPHQQTTREGESREPKLSGKGSRSKALLEILTQNIGREFTYEELAKELYPEGDKDIRKLVNRLQVLINISKTYKKELDSLGLEVVKSTRVASIDRGRKKITVLIPQKKTELNVLELGDDSIFQPGTQPQAASESTETADVIDDTAAENGGSSEHLLELPDSLVVTKEPQLSVEVSSSGKDTVVRREPQFKWEKTVRGKVVSAIHVLARAGYISENGKQVKVAIPIGNFHTLRFLFEAGIISEEQFKTKKLDLAGGVSALLLKHNGTRHLFNGKTPQKVVLQIIGEEAKDFLMHYRG